MTNEQQVPWWDETEPGVCWGDPPQYRAATWAPRSNVHIATFKSRTDVNLVVTLPEFADVSLDIAAAEEFRDALDHAIALAHRAVAQHT